MLPRGPRRARAALLALAATVAAVVLSGCSGGDDAGTDPQQVDAVTAPDQGACRVLTPGDLTSPTNASATVPCTDKHTAETFAVGDLPAQFTTAAYDDEALSAYAFETCSTGLQTFLGADESTVMRTVVSWAWFRPSEKAWAKGARWYRCDVVGGGETSTTLLDLPKTASGLLTGPPEDTWMACVDGPSVQGSPKIACTAKHNWRAVTTIKVGDAGDAYPGDTAVQATTRDFCSKSVAAWLGYPKTYDYGYTWFHRAEWDAGNRRSVCWAATAA